MSTLDNGVFCVMCENAALKECDRLVAENEKLRKELALVGHIAMSNVVASIGREESLEDENAKLRELLVGAYEDMDAWQKVIASSDQWGYGKGCLDHLCELRDAMHELGIEAGE